VNNALESVQASQRLIRFYKSDAPQRFIVTALSYEKRVSSVAAKQAFLPQPETDPPTEKQAGTHQAMNAPTASQ